MCATMKTKMSPLGMPADASMFETFNFLFIRHSSFQLDPRDQALYRLIQKYRDRVSYRLIKKWYQLDKLGLKQGRALLAETMRQSNWFSNLIKKDPRWSAGVSIPLIT